MAFVTTVEHLESLYGVPNDASTVKEIDRLIPEYRALIEASPFAVLATSGPEGLDCSPRGDRPGFVRIRDDKTLLMLDRRGNNRVDSLRNIVRDPRSAILFLIPGLGTTLRVNGRSRISIEPELLASFAVDERAPRSVIELTIDAAYFQCARAIVRCDLWNATHHRSASDLPTAGQILAALSDDGLGGAPYDDAWKARAAETLW